VRTIISATKKNKVTRKKHSKLLGITFAMMVLATIGFDATIETAPTEQADEPKKIETSAPVVKTEPKEEAKPEATEEKKTEVKTEPEKKVVPPGEVVYQPDAIANAEEYPAKPGAMLYDKTESKFKGMNYHLKGELIKIEKVEGLFGVMEDALLVKNEQGYVMPIFPPYEVSASVGDEIEVWGPLSGDGYASSDLGVDNVVGMTGAMNATRIDVNGETR